MTGILANRWGVLTHDVSCQAFAHVRSLDAWTHRETDGSVSEDRTFGSPQVGEVVVSRPCVVEVLVESLVSSPELALELTSY